MDRQNEIVKQILESDERFRKGFDKNSECYHGGDPTPVPLGGSRIPEGMTEYQTVTEEEKTPDDPRYSKVMELRTSLQEFKKVVSGVCPAVETKIRISQSKDNENKEKSLEKH